MKTVTANIKIKDVERIKAKFAAIKDREEIVEAINQDNAETKKLEKAVTTLSDQVSVIQDKLLGSYRAEFVECRDMGHSWKVKSESVEDGRFSRLLNCSRCHTLREELISKLGVVLFRKYTHPDGYLLSSPVKGLVGFDKSFWRGIQFSRAKKS